jgi:beta-1,4-mannooligosaccharide/beta-1,4-mannosyl-N-acetylglucosamine phosphorylase
VFNSAVLPHAGEFVGVFRADHGNGRANLHFGRSRDGRSFVIDDAAITWQDEHGAPAPVSYGYARAS